MNKKRTHTFVLCCIPIVLIGFIMINIYERERCDIDATLKPHNATLSYDGEDFRLNGTVIDDVKSFTSDNNNLTIIYVESDEMTDAHPLLIVGSVILIIGCAPVIIFFLIMIKRAIKYDSE